MDTAESSPNQNTIRQGSFAGQKIDSDQHILHPNTGSAPRNQSQPDETKDFLEHQRCGVSFLGEGDYESAIRCLIASLQLRPDCLESLLYLGQAYVAANNLSAALDPLLHALLLAPESAEAHLCMADALRAQGDHQAALECFQTAHSLRPLDAAILLDLGCTQTSLGLFENAAQSFRRSSELNPSLEDAWINLAAALHVLGDIEDSLLASQRALALKPDQPLAVFNRSLVQLLIGDYAQGLDGFEYRLHGRRAEGLLCAHPPCPRWDHPSLPPTGSLLLVSEQGLGDTVQFMRYLPGLRSHGLKVQLCAPKQLHTLLQVATPDEPPMAPEQATLWTEGSWLPLLSLPRLLGVRAQQPLTNSPYLHAPAAKVEYWSNRLEGERRPLLGLHWQGNPSSEVQGLWCRSLALEQMGPIAASGIGSLLSLQKGHGSEQRQHCSFAKRFVACQEEIDQAWDFLDALALIVCCDLVITSDSCVAHLAGALGHPTWLLLPRVPDWRWGLAGDRTAWYPSMQLFRQQRPGDWNEVMGRVAATMPEFLLHAGLAA